MKLTTRKYVAFTTFCLIICFILISIFGIHSRFGDTVSNHFKGWENIRFSQDFDHHTEMILKTSNPSLKLNDTNLAETINNRLQNLGFTDNKIAINKKNDQLLLKFTQPAGVPELYPQTIENLICLKGEVSISSSNTDSKNKNKITLNSADIKSAEIVAQPNHLKRFNPDYGIRIKFNNNGSSKLETLTKQMVAENEKTKKEASKDRRNKKPPAKLNVMLDQTDITKNTTDNSQFDTGGITVTEPITDGQIEIFNNSNLYDLKMLAAVLNEKPLPDFLYMEKLQKASPNLGMWFKRITIFAVLTILAAIILILILKFKLIGIICSTCLMGHFCFMLAGFSGFFEIYPGAIFNFAALIGTTLSALIGVNACFLIGKNTEYGLEIDNNQFIATIKQGLNKSLKITNMINGILAIASLVFMAVFSYKTNTINFILKPIYNLIGLDLIYSNSIASLAYATFVGSIGALLFENLLLKFIATSLTSVKIKLNLEWVLILTKKIMQLFKLIKLKFINFKKTRKTKVKTEKIKKNKLKKNKKEKKKKSAINNQNSKNNSDLKE